MCGCAPCGGVGGGKPGPPPMEPPKEPKDGGQWEWRPVLPFGQGIFVDPFGESTGPGPGGPRMFWVSLHDMQAEPGTPPAPDVEDAHVHHLGELQRNGQLHFVAHDREGISGFLLISAQDADQALEIVRADPLIESGYYAGMQVTELDAPYPRRTS